MRVRLFDAAAAAADRKPIKGCCNLTGRHFTFRLHRRMFDHIRCVLTCNSFQYGKMVDSERFFAFREITLATKHEVHTLQISPPGLPWNNPSAMRTIRFQARNTGLSVFPSTGSSYVLQNQVKNKLQAMINEISPDFNPQQHFIGYKGPTEIKNLIESIGYQAWDLTGEVDSFRSSSSTCPCLRPFQSKKNHIHRSEFKARLICQAIGMWDTI
jgi:hypothetical protein